MTSNPVTELLTFLVLHPGFVGQIDKWGRFLPEHTTAVSLLDRLLHHSIVVLTEGESFRMKEARQRGPRGGGRQFQKP
jgi:hypothetical protein